MKTSSVATVALLLVCGAGALFAQPAVRATVGPWAEMLPSDAFTVTFSRPVVSSLDSAGDPARFVWIEPALKARVEWRSVSTIRIVPEALLEPGRRYQVSVDSAATTFDGVRIAPVRVGITVLPPRLLASTPSIHDTDILVHGSISTEGPLQLVFTSPLTDSLAAFIRFEGCTPAPVRFRLVEQRPVRPSDPRRWRDARESPSTPERTVASFVPADVIPANCKGTLVLPNVESWNGDVRLPVTTAAPFTIAGAECADVHDCARAGKITLRFTSPVQGNALERAVHVDGAPTVHLDGYLREATPTFTIRVPMMPRRTYTVRVDSTLEDQYGRPIGGPREMTIVAGDRAPDFGYDERLVTIAPGDPPVLTVRHLNVDRIELLLMPVPDEERFHAIAMFDWLPFGTKAWVPRDTVRRVVVLSAPLNESRVTAVPLPELMNRFRGQLVAVQGRLLTRPPASPPPDTMLTRRAWVQASDLVVHTRLALFGGGVWVRSMRTGEPVPGARVRLIDTAGVEQASATTDDNGLARPAGHRDATSPADADTTFLPRGVGAELMIEVSRGDDRSVLMANSWSTDMPAGLATDELFAREDLTPGAPRRGVVYTDRGIYRPGDTVHVGAIVREGVLGALHTPVRGDSARLRIQGTRRRDRTRSVLCDVVLPLSSFGTLASHLKLGDAERLDAYTVSVALWRDSAWRVADSAAFRVAAYRAPAFLVHASVPDVARIPGDTIIAAISARYLFDAPAAGAEVRWSATFNPLGFLQDADVEIPGLGPAWVVGGRREYEDFRYAPLSGAATLDGTGSVAVRIPTGAWKGSRPVEVVVDVAVTDASRQVVTTTTRARVHPAAFYLAVRDPAPGYWVGGRAPHRLNLLAVRPGGEHVAGVPVGITVVRRYREWVDSAGFQRTIERVDTVQHASVVTGADVVPVDVDVGGEGTVTLIATATDENGRPTRTALSHDVWAGWDRPGGPASTRLLLTLARDRLRPGDTAEVTFTSPFDSADVWIAVERETLLRHHVVRGVRGLTTVRIPLLETDVPNVFVSVTLVRRGAAPPPDSLHHRMRLGIVALRVDDAAKRLTVGIRQARHTWAPGDSATIEVQVRDAAGAPARSHLTIWAVDEGVFALTGYEVPDPVRTLHPFTRPGAHSRTTWSAFASARPELGWHVLYHDGWFERMRLRRWRFNSMVEVVTLGTGGSEDVGRDDPVRMDFHATAFYRTDVLSDSGGIARIRVKLPDNLTTYRIVAVGVGTGDRYGSAVAPLVITKPLVVRAAMPRFIRVGDAFAAGAVLNARDGVERSVSVTAQGSGGIALVGSGDQRAIAGVAATEVRFRWRASEGDSGRVRLRATANDVSDGVAIAMPVRPDRQPRAITLTGIVRDTATVRFRVAADIDDGQSRLVFRIGSSPVPLLRAAGDYMASYPYAGTEQLASRGRVLLALLALEREGLHLLPDTGATRQQLQQIIGLIAQRQQSSGGIGFWDRSSWSSDPLDAYVAEMLLDARDAGVGADTAIIGRLTGRLRAEGDSLVEHADTTLHGNEGQASHDERVSMHLSRLLTVAAALRRAGAPHARAEGEIDRLAARLVWEDRVRFTRLVARRGDVARARGMLASLWAGLANAGKRIDVPVGHGAWFFSSVRPDAELLTTTMELDPLHPRVGALVEGMTTSAQSPRPWRWWNTQDYAAFAVSLAAFVRAQPRGDVRVEADLGTRSTELRAVRGALRDTTLSISRSVTRVGNSAEVVVHLRARGAPAFYALTLTEVAGARSLVPESRGVTIERWFERYDDGRVVTEVEEGDMVRVRLRITVPAVRQFLALEDELPAGLEAVDVSLATSSAMAPFYSAAGVEASAARDQAARRESGSDLSGAPPSWSWYSSPTWDHSEIRDDRVMLFSSWLREGTWTLNYLARATTAGRFVLPQAHAEEMYDASVNGRSEGGWFVVREKPAKAGGR